MEIPMDPKIFLLLVAILCFLIASFPYGIQ